MNPARTLLLSVVSVTVLVCSTPAAAQWAWRDAAGRMVYSDQPPPKSIADRNIVLRPGPSAPPPVAAAEAKADVPAEAKTPAESSRVPARAAAPTIADREIESRRRQQQLADAEKAAADDEARKAQAAENCERLRAYQRALEGGHRIARISAAGQQEILDDAARTAERERTRVQIAQHCQ